MYTRPIEKMSVTNIEEKNTNYCLRNHLTVEKFREFKMFRNLLQQMFFTIHRQYAERH